MTALRHLSPSSVASAAALVTLALCPPEAAAVDTLTAITWACTPKNCPYSAPPAGRPNGPLAPASVSANSNHTPSTPDEDSHSLSASASIEVDHAAQWRAFASVGGYYVGKSIHSAGGAGGSASVTLYDELTAPAVAGWNGPGTLRFSFRITGDAFVEYSGVSGATRDRSGVNARLSFECFMAIGPALVPCTSPDLPPPSPGAYTLGGGFDLDGPVDHVVRFDLSVYPNQTFNLGLTSGVGATLSHLNLEGTTTGRAVADLTHTGRLVDVQLFDHTGAEVPSFTLTSGSGFDYLAAAAVPEPASFWLFGAGLAGAACLRRARGRAA